MTITKSRTENTTGLFHDVKSSWLHQKRSQASNIENHKMPDDEVLTILRIISRVGMLLFVAAIITYLVWEMFSESAALSRLSATAQVYHYTQRCDADGNPISTGQPNCVDLNRYVFVHGPPDKAFRRACSGKTAEMLSFERGNVSTFEINLVDKMLQFRARNGVSSPC